MQQVTQEVFIPLGEAAAGKGFISAGEAATGKSEKRRAEEDGRGEVEKAEAQREREKRESFPVIMTRRSVKGGQ